MKKSFILFMFAFFLISFVACSEKKLPEGSYKIEYDNMEPYIMVGAIVKIEVEFSHETLQIGDYVLVDWSTKDSENEGIRAYIISEIQERTIGEESFTIYSVDSTNDFPTHEFYIDDIMGVIIDIKNP